MFTIESLTIDEKLVVDGNVKAVDFISSGDVDVDVPGYTH